MPISEKNYTFREKKIFASFFIIVIAPLQSIKQFTENKIIFIHFLQAK